MIDFTFVLTRKKKEKTLIKNMEVILTDDFLNEIWVKH